MSYLAAQSGKRRGKFSTRTSTIEIDWQLLGGYDFKTVTKIVINGVWEWKGSLSVGW